MKSNKLLFMLLIFFHIGSLLGNENPLVISLGYRCQVAIQTRVNNLREAAYPFDWLITSFDSLCALIENDFVGFLQKKNLRFRCNRYCDDHERYFSGGYRCIEDKKYKVLFRHDFDLKKETFINQYEEIKEKYDRRIKRFYEVMNSGREVYFIRRIITKEEAIILRDLLYEKFPKTPFKLIAIDHVEEIKTDWGVENIINLYLPFPEPYNRQGDYNEWTNVFNKINLDPHPINMDIEVKEYIKIIHPLYQDA